MSTITPLLTYLLSVISNTIALALSFGASIGIAIGLCEGLKAISLTARHLPSNEKNAPSGNTFSKENWEGVFVFSILGTIVGYIYCMIHFSQPLGVIEAALWTTVTLIGIDIGLAIPAAAIICISRAGRRTE